MRRSLLVLSGLLALPVVNATSAPVAAAAPAAAEVATAETAKAQPAEFVAVTAKTRELRKSGEWQRPGWKNAELEDSLKRLTTAAQKAAGRAELTVGTPLAGLQPVVPPAAPVPGAGGRLRGVIQISGDAEVGFADASVFLVDGSIHVAFANDCVIIASGAVEVSHGRRNLIVAGHFLHTSHDGNPRPPHRDAGAAAGAGAPIPASEGSLLVSGRVLDVSHANGTICVAPELVRISHADGVTFLNSPNAKLSFEANCQRVNGVALPLAPPLPDKPLQGKLTVTQAVRGGDARRGSMAVVEDGGVELVVRPGRPIVDGTGKPMPGLEGWSLSYVNDEFALFTKGEQTAGFFIPVKP